jgi:multidrug efflux pump subunit AcrA (membrane-fusion protein)
MVIVSFWSQPEARFDARVREIAPSADPITRAFRVRATVTTPSPIINLGMTADVQVTPGEAKGVSLPIAAVFDREGVNVVWVVVNGGSLHLAPVKIAGLDGNRYLIGAGVRPGDVVVTAGVHRLAPSDHVAFFAGGERTTLLGETR